MAAKPDRGGGVSADELLHALETRPELAQAYQTLITRLYLLHPSRPLKSMLLTSSQPYEGKTTVTVNLGFALAMAGRSTIIVDADLRRPRIHEVFGFDNAVGLADVLTGSAELANVARAARVGRQAATLRVITSGAASRALFGGALESPRMAALIKQLTAEYDVVLLDSPPVLSVTDALLLGPVVDGVILVLSAGTVTERDARRAKERIGEAGGQILGVVMNRFNERLHGQGFNPYSYY